MMTHEADPTTNYSLQQLQVAVHSSLNLLLSHACDLSLSLSHSNGDSFRLLPSRPSIEVEASKAQVVRQLC